MNLRFERWAHPGFDWLLEPDESASEVRLEFALGSGRMRILEHAAIARILAVRTFVRARSRSPVVVRARLRAHLEAALSLVGVAPPSVSLELRRLSWSLAFAERRVQDGLRGLEDTKDRWPHRAPSFEVDAARILIAVGMPDEAVRFLPREQAQPLNPEAEVAAATFDRTAGHPSLALPRLDRLLVTRPTLSNDAKRDRAPWLADALLERARSAWASGAQSDALGDLERLGHVRPTCDACARNLIQAQLAVGALADAKRLFSDARPFVRADEELREHLRAAPPPPSRSESGVVTRRLQGDLSVISLSDILGVLGHSRSSGCLFVKSSSAKQAELRLHEGRLVDARLPGTRNGRPVSSTEEHVLRVLEVILEWEKGQFRLEPGLPPNQEVGTALETPVALLQACANLDARKRGLDPVS